MTSLEIWGGLECTVARVRDAYVDQTVMNGHEHRLDDIDRFASLGIKRIRYPVLWERVAPDDLDRADWRWTDQRLNRLREVGIRPIVGLVHHGSGPRHTSLEDPGFASGLADFAARVAERYPWIDAYTPVNEPLTTARFSGLYGFWYPHAMDERRFLRMLVNETLATQQAMAAIRRVSPAAQLVQTEDLGKVHSTPQLAHVAEFQNERRWLSIDLLLGRVDHTHLFWPRFQAAGLAREIAAINDDPCPPDILGFNHYPTSERFLDHRYQRYDRWSWGATGRDRYADIEAMSILVEGPVGLERLLCEAWERFGLPMAVTEAHDGSTRDEQLRWLHEVWETALRLRADGIDMRAVTVWSLLGSYDWNRLLTNCVGYYEPGPFDVRSPTPRETALAGLVRQLGERGKADHPVLDSPGRWHRTDRLAFAPIRCCPYTAAHRRRPGSVSAGYEPRRLMIIGRTGTLGNAFARLCTLRGLPYDLIGRREIDITDASAVMGALAARRPWAVVNAAGFVDVDAAENSAAETCRSANACGATTLATACAEAGIPLLTFSSDLVFDGEKAAPYVESDAVNPLNVYGATKVEAERAAVTFERALVVRTGAFFGPWDSRNFVTRALQALQRGQPFAAPQDVVVSPTYVPDLVSAALDLLIDGETGLWHLANAGAISWAELAREAARRARLDPGLVRGVPVHETGWRARRPLYSVLASERGNVMPSLETGLEAYFSAVPMRGSRQVDPLWAGADIAWLKEA
ncbi:family 1 glycosylhydrolase [Arenibaculum pallidiluteum]|uniref:family 1 glycosylhydrolase n=1 Tax=Arenibaculum pallidiluteum TaxID=2812559 RepID=UPI001A97B8EF|nr:family 1 glycosylhydrolase [Arenibaculum pallidiluteum]